MTNNTTDTTGVDHLTTVHYVAIVLYFAYGLFAVIGNVLLIVAMSKARLFKYGGFLTLGHYALTDVISGGLNVVYVPWSIACKCQFVWHCVPGIVIIFGEFSRKIFLIFMALTKFASVVDPLRARMTMTLDWYKKALLVTWFVACLSCLPFWVTCSMYFDESSCKWAWQMSTRKLTGIYGATVNVLTTVILLVTYPVCFYKLFKRNRFWQQANSDASGRTNRGSSREKSLLYMFAVNAAIFMLYWIPIYMFELWSIRIPYYPLVKETIRGIQVGYIPIAYCILNLNIRTAVARLICGGGENSTKKDTTLSDEDKSQSVTVSATASKQSSQMSLQAASSEEL